MQKEKLLSLEGSTVRLDNIELSSQRILDDAQELVAILDESANTLYLNRVWSNGLGHSSEEGIGQGLVGCIHHDDRELFLASVYQVAREQIVTKSVPIRLRHTDGSWRHFHCSMILHRNIEGNPSFISLIGRDMTDESEVERMKEEFLSVVSHELRNPLTSVKGYLSLMRRKGVFDKAMLDMALSQADVLQRLISDVLDVSRLQTGRLTLDKGYVFLPDLVQDVVEQIISSSAKHNLQLSIEADFPGLQGDPVRLKQAITNLVGNAVKYSPNGGNIQVSLSYTPYFVRVTVSDEGLGIPAEDLPRVWTRFFRGEQSNNRTYEGLGLGLHIVKAIVEAHGGMVWADSAEGKGSTFGFTLPIGDYSQQGDGGIRL